MGVIHKTDISKSPLLTPVIKRDYTSGTASENIQPEPGAQKEPSPPPGQSSTQGPNYSPPPPPPPPGGQQDTTKAFSFDEESGSASDIGEGEPAPEIIIPPASARTFANTLGSLIQINLPKLGYGIAKVDINNILINVDKGVLTANWIPTFTTVNENTEKALKISDETMKVWKSACMHWLEYQKFTFINPNTEFLIANGQLLAEFGINLYSCMKANQDLVRQAIEASNPGYFERQENIKQPEEKKEPEKTQTDGAKAA
jgi:hypothetical protein